MPAPQKNNKSKDEKQKDRPKSRGSTVSRASSHSKKESAVMTDGSLAILAREIGGEKLNGLLLAMYLNLPNTTIVNAANNASPCGLIDATDVIKIEATTALLLEWKSLRQSLKEKEKVKELERALREMGKTETADVINDKHANNIELTSDAFGN